MAKIIEKKSVLRVLSYCTVDHFSASVIFMTFINFGS